MSKDFLIGVDLGTSSVKTLVIDTAGRSISIATRGYPIDTPRPGWAEQYPDVWFQAAQETMGEALLTAGIHGEHIAAIGLSGQMHGLVCLDKHGKALRPAVIWADQRSQKQVRKIYNEIGREKLGFWTANPLDTGFMLASWLWFIENEPEVVHQTAKLLLPKDYLRYRLVGELGSEPSDASSTLMFDTINRKWSVPLLSALNIDPNLLPPIHESSEIAGGLLDAVAKRIGMSANTPVVYGGSDQASQAVGHSILDFGIVSSTIGTGGQLFTPIPDPIYDPDLRIHLFCHALPCIWHLEAAMLSAGLSLRWLRDNVFRARSYKDLADMAVQIPPGAEHLFFLPHLVGERTPYMDPDARAAFIGLTIRHNQGHLARAVMEGVVMGLRQGMEIMVDVGCSFERLVASGGGTQHHLWLQLQADILNCPIYQTETVEAAAMGAALLAGVGAGVYPDIHTACQQTVHWKDEVVQPISKNVNRYNEVYRYFLQLYPAIKSIS